MTTEVTVTPDAKGAHAPGERVGVLGAENITGEKEKGITGTGRFGVIFSNLRNAIIIIKRTAEIWPKHWPFKFTELRF